jgi:beta-lactamase class A
MKGNPMIDRRCFLLASGAALLGAAAPATISLAPRPDFPELEARLGHGGRLGVSVLDTGSGRRFAHRQDERFALCSTFKLALAAAILADVDRGRRALTDEISFGAADLFDYAPVVRANLARGRLSIEELCAAVIEVSDNSAANLLLRPLGGPPALTAFFRRCGDRVSRLDRYEVALGSNLPADPRDTTSPAAMLGLMHRILLGDVLRPESRARLLGWMDRVTTGMQRLRAGFPDGWRVGNKTGTGASGAANDIAIAWPPGRPPILLTCYLSGGSAEGAARDAVHASVAAAVVSAFA